MASPPPQVAWAPSSLESWALIVAWLLPFAELLSPPWVAHVTVMSREQRTGASQSFLIFASQTPPPHCTCALAQSFSVPTASHCGVDEAGLGDESAGAAAGGATGRAPPQWQSPAMAACAMMPRPELPTRIRSSP